MEADNIKKTAYGHLSSGLLCAETVLKTVGEQYTGTLSDDLLMKTLEDLMNVDVVYLSELPSEYMIDELLNKSIEDLMCINVVYSS